MGCQALSEMIQFYLVKVMPQAEKQDPEIKEHLNSLGEKLKTLRKQLRRCVSSRPVLPPPSPRPHTYPRSHPTNAVSYSPAGPQAPRDSHRLDRRLGGKSIETPSPESGSLAHLSPSESGSGFEALTREDLRIAFRLFVSHCGLLATPLSLRGKARASSVMAPEHRLASSAHLLESKRRGTQLG